MPADRYVHNTTLPHLTVFPNAATEKPVLLNNGWLDRGWTDPGHKIQLLSKVCPYSVKSPSNGQKSTGSVQSLSNWCGDPVQVHGLWTKIGQENPALVHRLSNRATNVLANADVRHLLDIFWTRQTMDKTCTLGYSGWAFISRSQISDIVWTDIGLDKLYTKPRLMAYTLAQAQILDIVWTIMGYGQTLD